MSAILGARAQIFLSYRREDASGHAGRLHDDLVRRFGDASVFMDVDAIPLGRDFVQVIEDRLQAAKVLLVVIGRQWLTATDAQGRRRLDDPDDFVRIEIAAAFAHGVRVIPVLVNGATMPSREQLPDALAPLARCQALSLTDQGWRRDVAGLVAAVQPPPPTWLKVSRSLLGVVRRNPKPSAIALGVLVLAIVLLVVIGGGGSGPGATHNSSGAFSFTAAHPECGTNCSSSLSSASVSGSTLTLSYSATGYLPSNPCIQIDGGRYELMPLTVDNVVEQPPNFSGTMVFPFVVGGSYEFQFSCGQTTPAPIGTAVLRVVGVSSYQPQPTYFAVVTRVARNGDGLRLGFAAVGSPDLDQPSSSCLQTAQGTQVSAHDVQDRRIGGYEVLITGTMDFPGARAGAFQYGCSQEFSTVQVG